MFAYAGWILFGVALLVSYLWHKRVSRSQMNLYCYLTMIMFDDVSREEQRERFVRWLRSEQVSTDRLLPESFSITQVVADRLAKGDGLYSTIDFTMNQLALSKLSTEQPEGSTAAESRT